MEERIIGKKYELTENTEITTDGHTLHQIRALRDFKISTRYREGNNKIFYNDLCVKAGELGGWIEEESNLSQKGECWVYKCSNVYGGSRVSEDALIANDSNIIGSYIAGNSTIYGDTNVVNSIIIDSTFLAGELKDSIIYGLNIHKIEHNIIRFKEFGKPLTLSTIEKLILWENGLWKNTV